MSFAPTSLGGRYQTAFDNLKAKNEGAFVPFVTLGDPGPELSVKIIKALIDGGADALELGSLFQTPVLMALPFKMLDYVH